MEEDPNGGLCNLFFVYLGYFKQGKTYKCVQIAYNMLSVRQWHLSTASLRDWGRVVGRGGYLCLICYKLEWLNVLKIQRKGYTILH